MLKKLVIANLGRADMGKTTSIRKVFNILSTKYPETTYTIDSSNGEVKATIKIGDVLVGIETQGDPGTRMPDSLDEFVNMECGIILVACRSTAYTLRYKVESLEEKGYEILWLPNGKTKDNACWEKLTDNYANYVTNVIEKCIQNGRLTKNCL